MSSTLNWKPVETSKGYFENDLKRILGRYFFGGDGSVWHGSKVVNYDFIDYLKGLRDGGNKDAGKLIKLIEKHGSIELFLEY